MPANTRIRLKLIHYLLKSREAAATFPACIQVTFDLLFGAGGNSNAKLRMLAVTMIHHIVLNTPAGQRLDSIGPVLLSALTRLVNEEKDNPKLRASCYIAIGKLGLKVPQLVNKDVTVLQTFFDAISREDKDTQLSVQEAMSMMTPAFKRMDSNNLKFVEAMLGTYIEKEEQQVRLVAVQYAGDVFPATHVPTRYILLLGSGDAKEEVSNQAKNHLYGALHKLLQQKEGRPHKRAEKDVMDKETILPAFTEMLEYVLDKASIRARTQQKYVVGDKVLAFSPKIYVEVLNFLRMCLICSSGADPTRDALTEPEFAAPTISRYISDLSKQDDKQVKILQFIEFADKLLSATQGAEQALCMLQLVGVTFKTTAFTYYRRIGWLKGLLDNTREDIRETVAHLYGIVVGQVDKGNADFEKAITELTRSFKEKSLEFQHGIVLALGHSFGRKILLTRLESPSEAKNIESWGSYKKAVELVTAQLNSSHAMMIGAACTAIGEMGRSGPLPLPDDGGETDLNTKLGLCKKLLALMKSGKVSMKARERAALALGLIGIGDGQFQHRRYILDECLKAGHDIKDLELHFTMGDAIAYASMGPRSPMARDLWQVSEEDFVPLLSCDEDSGEGEVKWVLDQLCNEYVISSHPYTKQASCMWLLGLVKHAGKMSVVQERLFDIQSAFMSLLGDSNDVIQDAASKGLGLVYDSCTEEQQSRMVDSLLKTLMDGKREVQKVSGETKIFGEGEMGKAPSGGNITTYKELCSLATDLNQPDLVYKFMHLANYNATWNSRKGAAFGFGSIAARAGEQLEEHLPKVVPKLYRYQFDPTPNVNAAMSSIWNSLISETNKTVDKYFDDIIKEISTHLTSSQWRVRESCCNALQDLLRGRTLDDALGYVPLLWNDLFRVMDDIKESVRLAASKAIGSLSRASIKMCDSANPKSGERAVQAVIPPLLETGLASSVAEVRAVVINTVAKVTKSAGVLLKPHLPKLIPALLEATGEMESKEVSYLSVRLANDGAIQEKVDMARIVSARSSPMMECVSHVLQFVDADTLRELVPRLVDLVKGNVGIGTKGATAHLITTLTHQCPLELQQYTGKILAAFVSGLADRNAAVRKTYASAIGHLMKTAKDSSLEKLFAKLRTWYMEKDDDASMWAVAYTYEAVNRHNPDRLKAHAAFALPVAFLAMHEELRADKSNEEILEIWNEVWSDTTPGTEGGIRMYLKEIMSLLEVAIDSSQWKVKAQAARAMGTVAQKMKDTLPEKEQRLLLTVLINALAGRTWDGKEAVVKALSDVCVSNVDGVNRCLIEEGSTLTADVLVNSFFRECKKEKVSYRLVAIESTGRVVKELMLSSYFDQLYDIVFPLIKKEEDPEDEAMETDEVDEEAEKEESEKNLVLRNAVYSCLGDAWLACPIESQEKYVVEVIRSLRLRVQSTTKKNQLSIARCLMKFVSAYSLSSASTEIKAGAFAELGQLLGVALSIPKHNQLRTECVDILSKSIVLVQESGVSDEVGGAFKRDVAKSLNDVIKDVSGDAASKAKAREVRKSLEELPTLPAEDEVENESKPPSTA